MLGFGRDSSIAGATAACGGMSFTRGIKVLLASGIAVPIASLKPGDKVLATNVRTGRTRAESVTAILVDRDTNRYNLTIKTAHAAAVIHTTTTHLFWNPATRQWATAGDCNLNGSVALSVGDCKKVDRPESPRQVRRLSLLTNLPRRGWCSDGNRWSRVRRAECRRRSGTAAGG